eukprot:6338372-Heterocapsa_arctica.AAC.1
MYVGVFFRCSLAAEACGPLVTLAEPRCGGRLRPPRHCGTHRHVLPGQPRRGSRLPPPGHAG